MKRNITIVAVSRIKSSIPPKKDMFSFIVAALLIISLFGSMVVINVSAVDINEINTTLIASETNISEIEQGAIHAEQSEWIIDTVDSAGNVGLYTSIAIDSNDDPHISYYDLTNQDLKYAKWTGSEWSINTVDSEGEVGRYTSIALDSNGYPHISYNDITNRDLKYAKWTGRGWSIDTVDSAGGVGGDHSIALDSNDYPHISYNTKKNLKYAKWTGSEWSINTMDSAGRDISIALDSNDYPHISYNDHTNQDLKYAKWTGSEWSINTVDSAKEMGDTSIALDSNDYPHISFGDYSTNPDNADLKYAKWTGSEWSINIVDSTGGGDHSIALDSNDYPHISYVDNRLDDLLYAKWTGSEWSINGVGSGLVGGLNSIALDSNDYPHISYYDIENNDLLYAKWTESGSVQENTSTLSIGSVTTSPNSTVTIPVSVANATNISGIYFDVLYNSSVVTVSNVSANKSFTGSIIYPDIDNANGTTKIVLTNSNYISASAETSVIDIAFNIISGFGSSTSLDLQNVEFGDAGFNPYTPKVVVDGQITVGIDI